MLAVPRRGLAAMIHLQLAQDRRDMRVDGAHTEMQRGRDLTIGRAEGQPAEHCTFSRSQAQGHLDRRFRTEVRQHQVDEFVLGAWRRLPPGGQP